MRVIFFVPRPVSLAFGGQEVQMMQTGQMLTELGVEVSHADYFDRDLLRGADLVHLFGSDYVYAQVSKLLNARRLPYVVSSVFYPVGRVRLVQTALARLPYSQSWLQKQVLMRAAAVLPNSRAEQRLLRRMFQLPDRRQRVVPNGVSVSLVGQQPQAFYQHLPDDFPRDLPFVLSVGRIEPRKNSLLLLRAAAALQAPIVFIGSPVESEAAYTAQFFRELERYPGCAVHLSGFAPGSPDLANAYAAAHVHALLSTLETPGLASLEAALNGANLVVGDCPPVREYFAGRSAVVKPDDSQAVTDALRKALAQPRDASGQAAYVQQNFTWERVARETLGVYRSVLERQR